MTPDRNRLHLEGILSRLCRRLGQPVVPGLVGSGLLNEIDALNRKLDRWTAHYLEVLGWRPDPHDRNTPRMDLTGASQFLFVDPSQWVTPPPQADPRVLGGGA